jgi:hypothetical protein
MAKRFDVVDIAGLKEASDERIVEVEKEALERKARMEKGIVRNDEDILNLKWYETVASRCDWELKQRGARQKSGWESLFE